MENTSPREGPGDRGAAAPGLPARTRVRGRGTVNVLRGLIRGYVLMILPQVHLRKPCYDFYFL